jgi:hypothetical protein
MSVLFCWCFLLLAVTGPGAWTLTRLAARPAVPTALPTQAPPQAPVAAASRADAETG